MLNILKEIALKNRTLERLIVKAPVYVRDFLADPAWLLMFICARYVQARRMHKWLMRHGSKRQLASGVDLLPASGHVQVFMDDAEFLGRLNSDGIATGLFLSEFALIEVRNFATSTQCYANFDVNQPMYYNEHEWAEQTYKSTILVGHFLEAIQNCPTCVEIANDRKLWSLARKYLGSEPKLISHRLWWSFKSATINPADASLAAQSYHFDLDDWNQVKFFFYIVDVEENDGPHGYILGSHRRKSIRFQASIFVGRSEHDIISYYGPQSILEVTGRAGSGFAEDSFGFHVGLPVERGPRLLLEVSFGSTGVMRRRPFGTH